MERTNRRRGVGCICAWLLAIGIGFTGGVGHAQAATQTCETKASTELFGVKLLCADRAALRVAALKAGATLNSSEGRADYFAAHRVIDGAKFLTFEFSDEGSLDVVAYQLEAKSEARIVSLLRGKYGESEAVPQTTLKTVYFRRLSDGVEVSVVSFGATVRLSYLIPFSLVLFEERRKQKERGAI